LKTSKSESNKQQGVEKKRMLSKYFSGIMFNLVAAGSG